MPKKVKEKKASGALKRAGLNGVVPVQRSTTTTATAGEEEPVVPAITKRFQPNEGESSFRLCPLALVPVYFDQDESRSRCSDSTVRQHGPTSRDAELASSANGVSNR